MPRHQPPATNPDPSVTDLVRLWLATALLVRTGGRTRNLDTIPAGAWAAAIAPLASPLTLVTAWNPGGRMRATPVNRAANRRLQASLGAEGRAWCPALGRARDGSWAEPGFAVGGLTEAEAAALGAEWGQLAVYVVTDGEVIVLASDRSFRHARPRGGARRG
jgi:hypothetical protein